MYKTTNQHYDGGIIIFIFLMDLFIAMGPPMFENQVKESQSRAAPPIFAQARVA